MKSGVLAQSASLAFAVCIFEPVTLLKSQYHRHYIFKMKTRILYINVDILLGYCQSFHLLFYYRISCILDGYTDTALKPSIFKGVVAEWCYILHNKILGLLSIVIENDVSVALCLFFFFSMTPVQFYIFLNALLNTAMVGNNSKVNTCS